MFRGQSKTTTLNQWNKHTCTCTPEIKYIVQNKEKNRPRLFYPILMTCNSPWMRLWYYVKYLRVIVPIFPKWTTAQHIIVFRSCIYKNENCSQGGAGGMQGSEPVPRFAHQLVYDHVRKVCYVLVWWPKKFTIVDCSFTHFKIWFAHTNNTVVIFL